MSVTLPSSDELQAAAYGDNLDHCRDLVLQALVYGTEESIGEESSSSSLKERTQETCKVLADAWEDCVALEDVLVDALWLRGSILTSALSDGHEAGTSNSNKSHSSSHSSLESLVEIIKILVQIPDRTSFWIKLQSNLMPSLIDACGLASEQDLLKRLKIHNTQVHYKQQKYNLLQEESEGYSKILHFLISGEPANDEVERRHHLRKLLGTFELDPNRVLDLSVDILEASLYPNGCSEEEFAAKKRPQSGPQSNWLLGVMKEFPLEQLPALIHFKLTGEKGNASPALLQTIAFLISQGLLSLKKMLNGYFEPIEKHIEEAYKVLWMKERRRIQALSRVSLSGTVNEDLKLVELAERLETSIAPLNDSQLLKLFLILLEWGEWNRVEPMLSSESWSHLCCLLPDKFGKALCDVASQIVKPWYQSKVGNPGLNRPEGTEEEGAVEMSEAAVTLDEVVDAVSGPLLYTTQSGCIAFHPVLFCHLCRLFRVLLDVQSTDLTLSEDTYNFFKTFLIPSLSLFPSNPAVSTELWSVLKQLPYATRYRLYEDWKGSGLEKEGLSSSRSGKPLPNVESEMEAGKAARYALKRTVKDNIRDLSRQLAKVTHSNPLVVYSAILNQIESYDNMVEVMVEAQRFANPLGLDVLGYCILSRLSGTAGGVNRSRLKEDGVNVSQWLQSLDSFTGAFYKRFPYVEFRGILSYLMRRLREGNVMELGILRTLLKVPGGYGFADYSPAESLLTTQLEGRAGSISLKRETMSFGIVEDANARASERIRQVLQTDGFGVTMLILIAQVRSRILFQTSRGASIPVKLVGNLYDSCQVVMSILLEFLTDDDLKESSDDQVRNSIEKYASNIPLLGELYDRGKFAFDVPTTWMVCRPLVRSASNVVRENGGKDGELSDRMKNFALTDEFRQSYETMLPEATWSILSPELFETFYTNSIVDVFFPEIVYSNEINRITKEIERIEQRNKIGTSNQLVSTGANQPKNETEERGRLKKVLDALSSDQEKQCKHVDVILRAMEENKERFFRSTETLKASAEAFLVECVYPRSTQSPDDALYCAHFSFQLHRLETPGFSTLHYIEELISVVSGSLFGLTEGEAANLAILLWETWKVVNKWRYDEALFDSEVLGKPGGFMESSDENGEPDCQEVLHKDFAALYNKWHASLGAALIGCLQSAEYMHMRSGLLVLTRIVDVFPTRPKLGNKLLAALGPLQDENSSRPDIRTSAKAYSTMLLKARDEGKWVEEDAAVAQARADQEKAAAEERKRKLEEQFQELKRDSEKITEEIGPRDGTWDRFDRRREGRDIGGHRAPAGPAPERGRGGPHFAPKENGELPTRDRRSPPGDPDRRRERERSNDRAHARNDAAVGERHAGDTWRRDAADRPRRDEPRTLAGRWSRGEPTPPTDPRGGRSSKRSRPPSPETDPDSRGSAKRPRVSQDSEPNYDSRRSPTRDPSPSSRRGRGTATTDSSRAAQRPRRRR